MTTKYDVYTPLTILTTITKHDHILLLSSLPQLFNHYFFTTVMTNQIRHHIVTT